jgi:hypothetical protein
MYAPSRRRFLSDLGKGMIVASVGASVAAELGFSTLHAAEQDGEITFGEMEPLVDFLQGTPPDKMLPAVVEKLKSGTTLKDLVSAASLANARAFGGEHYVGFHTLMALMPAFHMSKELPSERAALPVLKVLYRNSTALQEVGGCDAKALQPVAATELPSGAAAGEFLRRLVRERNTAEAERTFAGIAKQSPEAAFNELLETVEDGCEVHRTVLIHRAYDMLSLVGREQAHTMLRQSLRYCLKNEESAVNNFSGLRTVLPKLTDQYKLADRMPGTRTLGDEDVEKLVQTLLSSTAEGGAEAIAAMLADGFAPTALAEAVSLASNQLVLRDIGRHGRNVQDGKPEGSVHGDSIGVHSSDSTNAWRHIAAAGSKKQTMIATVMSGYQVAQDRFHGDRYNSEHGSFAKWQPRPLAEHLEKVTSKDPAELLKQLDGAIRESDQALACAIVQRYGEVSKAERPVFETLLTFATSEDGALHAEKYYRTVSDEFARTRPAFRWRQLVALARVTASEYGRPAPGMAQACELLGVKS